MQALKSCSAVLLLDTTELYPTWTPTSGPSTEPSDFKPPDGTFVVLYVGREPAACGKLERLDDQAAEIKLSTSDPRCAVVVSAVV